MHGTDLPPRDGKSDGTAGVGTDRATGDEPGAVPSAAANIPDTDDLYSDTLWNVLEQVRDLVMVTDRDGTIEYVNRAFETASKYSRQEVIGKTPRILNSGRHDDAFHKRMWMTISQGKSFRAWFVNRRRDGSLFIEDKTVRAQVGSDGRIRHFVATGTDITRRVQARRDLMSQTKFYRVFANEFPDIVYGDYSRRNLQESNPTLPALTARLLSLHELERQRISRELHDGIGSLLAIVKMQIEAAGFLVGQMQVAASAEALDSAVAVIQQAMDEIRRIAADLRPSVIDDLGIIATIGWFCRTFAETYTEIRIETNLTIEERDVPEELKVVMYRVLQESMNNIAKHANCDLVRVHFRKLETDIELMVEDNGCGFDVLELMSARRVNKGLGLTSMRERMNISGGTLFVSSTAKIGTVVRAVWPLADRPNSAPLNPSGSQDSRYVAEPAPGD